MSRLDRDAAFRMVRWLTVLLGFVALTGCSTGRMAVRYGRMPDIAVLERDLEIGVSTEAEVAEALGPRRTIGGMMLPVDDRARDVWFYYYETGSLELGLVRLVRDFEGERIFLFVMFDRGVYDGYLWFSSLPGLQSLAKGHDI